MKQEIVKIFQCDVFPYACWDLTSDDTEKALGICSSAGLDITDCEFTQHPQCPLNDKQIILVGE